MPSRTVTSGHRELMLRVGSALVLVPLAIGTAYLGGWPFALFWSVAALGVFWEWSALVAGDAAAHGPHGRRSRAGRVVRARRRRPFHGSRRRRGDRA